MLVFIVDNYYTSLLSKKHFGIFDKCINICLDESDRNIFCANLTAENLFKKEINMFSFT